MNQDEMILAVAIFIIPAMVFVVFFLRRTAEQEAKKCKTCKWWIFDDLESDYLPDDYGECTFNAPVPGAKRSVTKETERCSKYEFRDRHKR